MSDTRHKIIKFSVNLLYFYSIIEQFILSSFQTNNHPLIPYYFLNFFHSQSFFAVAA